MANGSAPAHDLDDPSAGSAFDLATRVLRDRGCRCPLLWSGVIPVPATICDRTRGHRCPVLDGLPPVPEIGTTSDIRKPAEPTRVAHPLDAVQSAGGD